VPTISYSRCDCCASWISYDYETNRISSFGIFFVHERNPYNLCFSHNFLRINGLGVEVNISNNVFNTDFFEEEFNFIITKYIENICLF
jgi:hypothetical protein